ncbi:uncharacterized protein LOC135707392 isoform X1 [Ochlerotatus camptorhynchus]|uniref:uncharacterized protein LOC135707392 isoform X1 n=1 Tax=Ochlerotatus camptorhynchus TaxID=644619 RepID=UPI0031DB7A0D
MCSGTTFKFLCYFYACCNTFCAISIAVGADKVSEKITRDNCSSTKFDSVGSHVPQEICNKKTYAALVFMLALGCFMSLLMVVGVALDKSVLVKSFRIFLYFNMIFLFGCWLAIFSAFYESHSSMLMLLWGFVLVLSIVYFGMQVWITSGAFEAISRKSFDVPDNTKQGTLKIFIQ